MPAKDQADYDVVTLGETMIRLSPPRWQRLEQAEVLEVVVGGAESNVAVCLGRLGPRVAWVSCLPTNPLGRYIVQTLSAHGMDVSHVRWVEEGRVGVYFVEYGYGWRATNVYHDRANSAMSRMRVEDFDESLLGRTRLVHLTGITPALSPTAGSWSGTSWQAGQRGVLRSFDVNYRVRLWPPDEASQVLGGFCDQADILFVSASDAIRVFGCRAGDQEAMLRWLRDRFGSKVTVLTLGEEGAMAMASDGRLARAEPRPTPALDPLGSGDAFCAAFLFAHLRGLPLQTALQYGVVAASLKRTIPGDLTFITPDDLVRGLPSEGASVNRWPCAAGGGPGPSRRWRADFR